LVDLISSLEESSTRGKSSAVIFLDLKQAFDCVPKEAILCSLLDAGIRGNMLSVLESYLSDRQIQGKLDAYVTVPRDISRGVPQGGVLSPILFNLVAAKALDYETDDVNISAYADDIVIWSARWRAGPGLQKALQKVLDRVVQYLDRNGLVISPSKTALLIVSKRRFDELNLSIQGKTVETVTQHRFLGIILDKKLTWQAECNMLGHSARITSNVLRVLAAGGHGMSSDSLLRVSQAITGSRILYALPHIMSASPSVLKNVRGAQVRDCKIALGLLGPTPADTTLAEAGCMPLQQQARLLGMNYMSNIVTQHCDHRLVERLQARPRSTHGMLMQKLDSLGIVNMPKSSAFIATTPIWELEQPRIETTITGVEGRKAELAGEVLRALFAAHMGRVWQGYQQVYTDGSTLGTTSSSAAVFFPDSNISAKGRLPFATSSTTSELSAIREACRLIKSHDAGKHVICTDSKSALLAIRGFRTACNAWLLHEILDELKAVQERGHTIGFQWTPSHCGIMGNETADRLATEAHYDAPVWNDITPSSKDVRRKILTSCKGSHEKWWQNQAGSHRWLVNSKLPDKPLKIKGLSRFKETRLHRLRTGVAKTGKTRHKLGFAQSPNCLTCNLPDTVSHVLLNCEKYEQERRALQARLRPAKQDLTLNAMLDFEEHPYNIPVVLEFLEDTGLLYEL
jgi:ribonuclease HI